VGENAQALQRLEGALDRDNPRENVLALLAGLKLKSEDYAAAADLYRLGVQREPHSAKWLKALAAVFLKSGQNEELAEVLAKLAAIDADDLPVRKKLAQLAVAKRDWPAAARWSLEGLYIQVVDVDLHRYRAEAFLGLANPRAAVDEYEAAVELDPEQLTLRLALAESLVKANEPAKARLALEELLKLDTGHAAARQLLETIK
jgi:tetratricopeptide (TPR) repeat protein